MIGAQPLVFIKVTKKIISEAPSLVTQEEKQEVKQVRISENIVSEEPENIVSQEAEQIVVTENIASEQSDKEDKGSNIKEACGCDVVVSKHKQEKEHKIYIKK